MSAIWGIVALSPSYSFPEHCAQLFESTYQSNCKIDRYENISVPSAIFGCGVQYITKESQQEKLPFSNAERGIVFTADCVLDNRTELIKSLSAHGFTKAELLAAPDGTLMYNAYLTFGNDCVKQFRGLYSFAVWEEKSRTLTLFSDHTASRSLYYAKQENFIAFSTRMEPLLKLFPKATPNTDYHKDFLLANPSVIYVTPGETPYREISLLTPATQLRINENGVSTSTYWVPGTFRPARCKSPKEYSTRFMELYRDCIRDALRTVGEVGIAMSSGLDSSSVGVLAAKELEAEEKLLHSYTFVPYFPTTQSTRSSYIYDESGLVQKIAANHPNMDTTFLYNEGKNPFADMKLCSGILEIPYKSGVFPNHYEMCTRGARKGCKVFLNGAFGNRSISFGDIFHISYDRYCKKKMFSCRLLLNRFAKHEGINPKDMFSQTLRSFRSFRKHMQDSFEHYVPENYFLFPTILQDYDLRERFSQNPYALFSGGYVDHKTFLQQLNPDWLFMYLGVFETQFGLHTGMLLRDPTKDVRLLEFCHHLPFRMFAYRGIPRWLIRSSFSSLLPPSVLESWSQHGLLNADRMMRIKRDWDTIKPMLLQHLSSGLLDDYINKEAVLSFIESFDSSEQENSYQMNSLCALEGLLCFCLPEEIPPVILTDF